MFTVYLTTCDVALSWDGVMTLRYPKEAAFIREKVDRDMREIATYISNHFGERVVQVQVQQVVNG